MPDCHRLPYRAAAPGIVILATFSFCGAAPSNPPASRPPPQSEQVRVQTAPNTQATQSDQSGTQAQPLIVNVQPSPQDKTFANEQRREHNEEASTNRWIAFFTGVTGVATVLLFVVGGIQVGLFVWQLRLIRKSLMDAERAAGTATNAANAAQESAVATKQSVESYVRGERPYVYMESPKAAWRPYLTGQYTIRENGDVLGTRHPPSAADTHVEYAFRNVGRTPAIIKEIAVMVTVVADLPATPDYTSMTRTVTGPIPLPAGDKTGQWSDHLGRVLSDEESRDLDSGAQFVFLIARIKFADVFGYLHTRGFAWRFFGKNTENFAAAGGAAYNYTKQQPDPEA